VTIWRAKKYCHLAKLGADSGIRVVAMLKAIWIAVLVLAGVLPALSQVVRIDTCFEQSIAALRLNQLEQGIAHCDKLIEDQATPPSRRGEALAQRGLMRAHIFTIVATPAPTTLAMATQSIADITESLRLHSPAVERRHVLLAIRAQLYIATGQTRRAAEDYAAILRDDPNNAAAKRGRDRLGPIEGL
jgi:tetratricopeptide (TPR) repeat protein